MTNIKRAAELLDGTILRPRKGVLAQRGARQAHRGERVRVGAADLQRAARGRRRRRHQPGRDDALQRRVLRRPQARRPPGAPVLHLALPDGSRGDRLVGRPGADLPQRLAGGDPDEAHGAPTPGSPCASTRASSGAASRRRPGEPYAYVAPADDHGRATRPPAGHDDTPSSPRASRASRCSTRARCSRARSWIKDERYTVRYDAQNAIVEVGPPKPQAEDRSRPRAETPQEPGRRATRRGRPSRAKRLAPELDQRIGGVVVDLQGRVRDPEALARARARRRAAARGSPRRDRRARARRARRSRT